MVSSYSCQESVLIILGAFLLLEADGEAHPDGTRVTQADNLCFSNEPIQDPATIQRLDCHVALIELCMVKS